MGHAAKKGDGKPEFCHAIADWIENWCNESVPYFEQFTLSQSTSKAMIRTLRCQACLIEDLFVNGYDFIMTARFQSDPLERRLGQYRQMSGRFLVGLKDTISEKIIKIKSLLKEGIGIDEEVKVTGTGEMEIMKLKKEIVSLGISLATLMLSPDSREVAVHIAGYTAKKFLKSVTKKSRVYCCKIHITGCIDLENPDHEYLITLNRGGLTVPSSSLVNYVCDAFAVLSVTENVLNRSKLTARNAAKEALSYLMGCCDFTCGKHKVEGQKVVLSTVINVFFNNRRKISTASVRKDNVVSFKKRKRET